MIFEIDYAIDCSEDFPAVNVTVEDEGVILDSMDKMTGPGCAVSNSGVENPGVKLVYATYMEHTITEEDVEACVFSNVATLKWSDDFGTYERQSNTVSVPVVKLDLVEPVITKYYTNVPKNGMYFTPDEVIDFAIQVSNVSTTETYRLFVTDPINPNAVVSAPQGQAANVSIHGMGVTWDDLVLAPGETVTLNVQYKVTWMDAEDGFMQNLAYYRGSNQAGEAIFNGCDPVIVPCGHDLPNVPELEKKPTLSKQAMTAPANGTYYTAGETVTYQITLTNTTDFALNNVSCTDVMTGAVPAFLGQESSIAVGASNSWSFVYTVTAADVKRGYISNFSYAQYDINQIDGGVISNVVVLDTDGKSNEPKTDRDGKRIVTHGKADICTRTLDGEAEGVLTYVRHICRKHLAVANEAAALIQMPGSGDETRGWNGALQLWLNAIDEQYSDLCSWNNDPAMQALIMEEQSAWKSQFNAWRSALTGTAAQNAQQAAEAAQRKAEQLCYEAHTAPATRLDTHNDQQLAASTVKAVTCGLSVLEPGMPDSREAITLCADHRSVLTEAGNLLPNAHTGYERVTIWKAAQSHWLNMLDQYTNACYAAAPDAAAQRLVAVERVTFGNWLEARKAMLEGLYSSNANAEEVLANELMNRVMEHCGK